MRAREIKFRGKRMDNGEWIYGWLFKDIILGKMCIQQTTSKTLKDTGHLSIHTITREVDSKTVGQFIGIRDKNGVYIYDGDTITAEWHWQDGYIVDIFDMWFWYALAEYSLESENLEVIGNIHEK